VVLAEELRAPMAASMPLFESEGWPTATADLARRALIAVGGAIAPVGG
jgi:hypothetical protein